MKKSLLAVFILLPLFANAQRSLKDVNRGTFPSARVGVTTTQEDETSKRPANTMDANGQRIGPKLVPVVIDGTVVFVPENKALVITNTQQQPTQETRQPDISRGVVITRRSFRDTPNPEIRNWPRKFLGVDKVENVLDGSGITVAVFDSGVNMHEQFSNDNIDVYDVTGEGKAADDYGHGSAVAGIIGGSGAGDSNFYSVAPGVRIKLYKIADENGSTNNIVMAKAVESVLEYNNVRKDRPVSIINISYGLGEDDPYLKSILKKAYDSGVTIIASAGNSGGADIAYPAAYDFVIAVAGVNHRKQFVSSSSRGAGIDFVAPGAGIFAPDNAQGYDWVRGTSFSCAYITGIAALASQAYQNKYGIRPTPAQLYSLLAKISVLMPDIDRSLQGNGSPDASKILSLI